MNPARPAAERLSAERLAYRRHLRTGRRPPKSAFVAPQVEAKFNPNHRVDNGQFDFARGGGARVNPLRLQVQYRPNPRVRIGGNSGAFRDPMTLEHIFPTLRDTPGGMIVGLADDALDLMGPSRALTDALTIARTRQLVAQIEAIDPSYRFDSLGLPATLEGQNNQLNSLQMDRAAAIFRVRGDDRPLQVETLHVLQRSVDIAYAQGLTLLAAGKLKVRLSGQEALGNFIDQSAARELRQAFNRRGIAISATSKVRVVGREYNSTGPEQTYRIPDARVGSVAFDWTLSPKSARTPQIRGFFSSDFKPERVVIVRPKALGTGSTYIITKPGK